ncbi:MAG: hypothetical protein U5L96_01165 [Owenweeksia sp.]|nr:hypothetical protein [Owenweeksia sp.]
MNVIEMIVEEYRYDTGIAISGCSSVPLSVKYKSLFSINVTLWLQLVYVSNKAKALVA